jgi:hypothetical protein
MNELSDRDRRDLADMAMAYRIGAWVLCVAFSFGGLAFAVRSGWGILRFVIPGGVQ